MMKKNWYGGITVKIENGIALINKGKIIGKTPTYIPMIEGRIYYGYDMPVYPGDDQVEWPTATLLKGAVKFTKAGGERDFISVKTKKSYDRLNQAQEA